MNKQEKKLIKELIEYVGMGDEREDFLEEVLQEYDDRDGMIDFSQNSQYNLQTVKLINDTELHPAMLSKIDPKRIDKLAREIKYSSHIYCTAATLTHLIGSSK